MCGTDRKPVFGGWVARVRSHDPTAAKRSPGAVRLEPLQAEKELLDGRIALAARSPVAVRGALVSVPV